MLFAVLFAVIYCISDHSKVSEGNCSKVVVRWGAKGEILEVKDGKEGQYLVNFPETIPLVSPHLAATWI